MCRFIETIKIRNGKRINLKGHSYRMNYTRNRHFHEIRDIDLDDIIDVPKSFRRGIVKCRVIYGRAIEAIEFEDYPLKQPKTFKCVDGSDIDYSFKYKDRAALDELYRSRGKADDILIFSNGLLTDSYYANVALYREGIWYTPEIPLLKGTFREKLLSNEKLVLTNIHYKDLYLYSKLKLFNALLEWSGHVSVPLNENLVYL